jgi:hypothetical protein
MELIFLSASMNEIEKLEGGNDMEKLDFHNTKLNLQISMKYL